MAHLMKQNPSVSVFEIGSQVLANYHATDGVCAIKDRPTNFYHTFGDHGSWGINRQKIM
jgi:hypothetical protein